MGAAGFMSLEHTWFGKAVQQKGAEQDPGCRRPRAPGIKDLAQALNMPYVIDRWIGGSLTNFKIINARVKLLEEFEKSLKIGAFDKYTKKERLMKAREMAKMSTRFEGLKKLTRMPDVVFVSSLKESALPVHEAKKMGVKVVAITNTDSNPTSVEFSVPANDRSKKSVDLIVDALKSELATTTAQS